MKKFELVFIPMPGMGHLVSMVELANVLVARDHRLTVTMLLMKLPFDAKANEYIQSLYESSCTNPSIRFIVLPELPIPEETKDFRLKLVLESYKPHVEEAVATLNISPNSPRLVGFVLDMFFTTMTDVAKQFEVPCYAYYTSSAGYLAFSFHLEQLYNQNNSNEAVEQLKNSDVDFVIPSFANPVSSKLIPSIFFNNKAAVWLHEQTKRLRSEVKGILINTFEELESHVINALSNDSSFPVPSLYPIGPVLQLKNTGIAESSQTLDRADILKWLDDQPPSSVLFLCFGSRGSFDKDQVEKIAQALEQSGVRFVWSLRQPSPNDEFGAAMDCANMNNILPEGFLDRTTDVGRVIGWAPQVEILEHRATGGFISHCGWNSTLESVWYGVPIATWPLYAEQHFNAFEMVVELELAVKITIEYVEEYKEDRPRIVSTEEIQSGIRMLMDSNNEIRKKVKAKSEESRKSIMEGGSSFISLRKFIDDVLKPSLEGGDKV